MFTLNFVDEGSTQEYELPEGETLIGREPTCDIVVKAPSVSRRHARIRVADGHCFLVDVGSRFGTSLKGKPLAGEEELIPGDAFVLGMHEMSIGQQVNEEQLFSQSDELDKLGKTSTIQAAVEPTTIEPGPAGEGHLLKLLTEVSQTLVAGQPLAQVLARVVDLVFDVVPAERAFLLLRESPDQGLTARVVRNRDRTVPEDMSLSRTVINRVMRERVAMLGADARSDPRLVESLSVYKMAIRSFMCAPLWTQSAVTGVLYCDARRTGQFTEATLAIFAALSNYTSVAIEQARLSEQLVEETKRRERLQRYHSPAVVSRILTTSSSADERLIAQERWLSVLFCDIVQFTKLSEGMTPTEVADFLNEFFTRMADVIFEHDGTLDKFIGDAILAIFGAPFDQEDHPRCAVEAALAMREALAAFNKGREGPPLQLRIAINTGRAMTGDIGSPRRREFTVLGDVVNTASRMEALAQPGQIIIGKSTYDAAKDAIVVRPLGLVPVRGKKEAVELFEVLGSKGLPRTL